MENLPEWNGKKEIQMSDMMNKLAYMQETKNLLKSKLGLADSVKFRDYVSAIPKASGWSQSYYDEIYNSIKDYTRTSDWLTMPTLVDGDEKCVILNPVYDTDSNFVAFTITGAYTVDWGDGIIENFASGIKAEHYYVYSAILDSTLCSKGYKQVLITITPQSVGNLTGLALSGTHTNSPNAFNGFLDIIIAGHNIGSVSCSSLRYLEIFNFVGTNSITNFTSTFTNCSSLQTIPLIDTSKGTDFSGLFQNCPSLQAIPLLNTSLGTSFNSMFTNCSSLQTIPLIDTSKGTSFYSMFQNCYSLQSIPLLNTSLGTNFSYMFTGCSSLQTIPLIDTSKGTSFSSMFTSCPSLQTIPLLITPLGTSFSSMFTYCYKLSKAILSGTKYSISYSSCSLSRQAIIDVFNALGTVTGQIITLTGNYGASSLTADDKLIATAKGWTVTI